MGAAICAQNTVIMKGCEIRVKLPHKAWYETLVHEVGHTLGIGHRQPFEKEGFAGVILSNDIMFGQTGFKRVITEHNVGFLIDHYGTDGWELPNRMPMNYTIPHSTEELPETHVPLKVGRPSY